MSADVRVETLTMYTLEVAAGIGRLMPDLDPNFSDAPTHHGLLREIIASIYHDQLVAFGDVEGVERVIGAASMSIEFGVGMGKQARLNDFVVDPSIQGRGVGSRMVEAMIEWCQRKRAHTLTFESEYHREAAHALYKKFGAEILKEDPHFKLVIPS